MKQKIIKKLRKKADVVPNAGPNVVPKQVAFVVPKPQEAPMGSPQQQDRTYPPTNVAMLNEPYAPIEPYEPLDEMEEEDYDDDYDDEPIEDEAQDRIPIYKVVSLFEIKGMVLKAYDINIKANDIYDYLVLENISIDPYKPLSISQISAWKRSWLKHKRIQRAMENKAIQNKAIENEYHDPYLYPISPLPIPQPIIKPKRILPPPPPPDEDPIPTPHPIIEPKRDPPPPPPPDDQDPIPMDGDEYFPKWDEIKAHDDNQEPIPIDTKINVGIKYSLDADAREKITLAVKEYIDKKKYIVYRKFKKMLRTLLGPDVKFTEHAIKNYWGRTIVPYFRRDHSYKVWVLSSKNYISTPKFFERNKKKWKKEGNPGTLMEYALAEDPPTDLTEKDAQKFLSDIHTIADAGPSQEGTPQVKQQTPHKKHKQDPDLIPNTVQILKDYMIETDKPVDKAEFRKLVSDGTIKIGGYHEAYVWGLVIDTMKPDKDFEINEKPPYTITPKTIGYQLDTLSIMAKHYVQSKGILVFTTFVQVMKDNNKKCPISKSREIWTKVCQGILSDNETTYQVIRKDPMDCYTWEVQMKQETFDQNKAQEFRDAER